jgi:hypothetical protein
MLYLRLRICLRSFLYLCFRIFLRRFLITLPMPRLDRLKICSPNRSMNEAGSPGRSVLPGHETEMLQVARRVIKAKCHPKKRAVIRHDGIGGRAKQATRPRSVPMPVSLWPRARREASTRQPDKNALGRIPGSKTPCLLRADRKESCGRATLAARKIAANALVRYSIFARSEACHE